MSVPLSLTTQVLIERYGVAMRFDEAYPVLKFKSYSSARGARQRGTFPVPVRACGGMLLVNTLDVANYLDGRPLVGDTPGTPTLPPPSAGHPGPVRPGKPGKPSNTERRAAAAVGLTVREYRQLQARGEVSHG